MSTAALRTLATLLVALASAVLLALPAVAQPPNSRIGAIGLHLASRHLPAHDYSNANPGAYVRTDDGITAGFYRNSIRRWSVYAGWTTGVQLAGPLHADITLGAITGYERAAVLPLVVPSLALDLGRYGSPVRPRIAYLPKLEKRGTHVVHLMVEWGY
jgi:hypothetical protein